MYGIDAEHLVVWIESLDGTVSYRAGVLCRRHADAMVVPLGWMLDDRREPVPRLFKTKETTAATPRPKRQRSHTPRDETGQLTLPGPEVELVAEPVAEPVAAESTEPSAPWKPVFDQRDDLDGLLTARSPLLSRAFGKRDSPPAS
jgi:hypothetical protein